MQTILIVAEAIGLVVGSLVAAALLCWLLWDVFRLVRHPEWTASAVLALLVLALGGKLPHSQFLNMVLTFAVIAAVPLWIAGRAWRRERQDWTGPHEHAISGQRMNQTALTQAAPAPSLYPAITACICEERPPTRGEIRVVASRLWREGLGLRFGSQSNPASFAARRILLRAAVAALSGRSTSGR